MDRLKHTLQTAMSGYSGNGYHETSYLLMSSGENVFAILSVGEENGHQFAETTLAARLINDHILIEKDTNDKPLVDALVQAGIPRQQIVLAYAGETITNTQADHEVT